MSPTPMLDSERYNQNTSDSFRSQIRYIYYIIRNYRITDLMKLNIPYSPIWLSASWKQRFCRWMHRKPLVWFDLIWLIIVFPWIWDLGILRGITIDLGEMMKIKIWELCKEIIMRYVMKFIWIGECYFYVYMYMLRL